MKCTSVWAAGYDFEESLRKSSHVCTWMRIDDKSNVGCYDFMKVRQTEENFAPMQAPGLQESQNNEK